MMTGETQTGGQERAPRVHRFLNASLYNTRLGTVPIILRDLSESGVGGRCDVRLIPGETVTILIPHADAMIATIIWAKSDRFGAEFAEHIDPETIRTKATASPYKVPHMYRPPVVYRRPGFHGR